MLSIRPYQKTDWTRLCAIHDRARIDELTGSVDLKAFLTLEQSAENEGLFDGELWVSLLDDLVVGFVAFDPTEITWLYVDPDYYRKGIGRALLRFALKQYTDKVMVEVLSGNTAAIQLYLQEGFKILERKKGVLTGNEDFEAEGLIMEFKK